MSTNEILEDARTRLERAEGELVVDLSPVRRLEPEELRSLEALAGQAEGRGVRVTLSSVAVDVYRVLKLVKLAPRFAFQE